MTSKKLQIFETTAVSGEFGKTVIPKVLRGILGLRPGFKIVWKTVEHENGDDWILRVKIVKKE